MKIHPAFAGKKTKPIAGRWPETRNTKPEVGNKPISHRLFEKTKPIWQTSELTYSFYQEGLMEK